MRVLPVLALSSAMMLGACTYPDGSLNVPATLALGAGAAIAGLAIASASDGSHYHRGGHGYYRRPAYGYGRPAYASGYGYRPYRRW